ncbi:hypothetical protein PHLGIDRAFT_17053 [Phlebiopsis gigantea 11061_1 CR5-6]|uniref:Uncharacterized protein n=1 Tax=Phlebiopsis gigantea (strain 11061_1 CR5-6) TaxID=745531 RepID=A0A0C3NAZ2_PHLG1|nr:hypothetical protein PHLGIDRAFT_17053 [Phlebiopsis gigantea 11061_1 CR5-6]
MRLHGNSEDKTTNALEPRFINAAFDAETRLQLHQDAAQSGAATAVISPSGFYAVRSTFAALTADTSTAAVVYMPFEPATCPRGVARARGIPHACIVLGSSAEALAGATHTPFSQSAPISGSERYRVISTGPYLTGSGPVWSGAVQKGNRDNSQKGEPARCRARKPIEIERLSTEPGGWADQRRLNSHANLGTQTTAPTAVGADWLAAATLILARSNYRWWGKTQNSASREVDSLIQMLKDCATLDAARARYKYQFLFNHLRWKLKVAIDSAFIPGQSTWEYHDGLGPTCKPSEAMSGQLNAAEDASAVDPAGQPNPGGCVSASPGSSQSSSTADILAQEGLLLHKMRTAAEKDSALLDGLRRHLLELPFCARDGRWHPDIYNSALADVSSEVRAHEFIGTAAVQPDRIAGISTRNPMDSDPANLSSDFSRVVAPAPATQGPEEAETCRQSLGRLGNQPIQPPAAATGADTLGTEIEKVPRLEVAQIDFRPVQTRPRIKPPVRTSPPSPNIVPTPKPRPTPAASGGPCEPDTPPVQQVKLSLFAVLSQMPERSKHTPQLEQISRQETVPMHLTPGMPHVQSPTGSSNGSGRLQEYFSDECVLHLRPTGNGAAELSHGEEKQAGKSHVATYVDAVASSARGKRLLHGTFGAEKRSGDPPPEETERPTKRPKPAATGPVRLNLRQYAVLRPNPAGPSGGGVTRKGNLG